jgi:hypothetical protein
MLGTVLFFSPKGVSSTYCGRVSSSAFFSALAFFSLLLLVAAGGAFATLAFFWSNLACFSAFFRSRSTVRRLSQRCVHYSYLKSYMLRILEGIHTFFLALHLLLAYVSFCSPNLATSILSWNVRTYRTRA